MKRALPVLSLALFAIAACARESIRETVTPSPTADEVLAQQYRARAEQGAMSGPEAQIITDSYRSGIAKPAAAEKDFYVNERK